jgi:plastocyanin
MSQRSRQRKEQQRRHRRIGRAALAILATLVLLGIAMVACNGGGDGGSAGSGNRIVMTEFAFDPDPITIAAGDTVLELVNEGAVDHNLLVGELGRGSPSVKPGGSYELGLEGVEPGTYRVVCDLPGHTEAGMVTELIVR